MTKYFSEYLLLHLLTLWFLNGCTSGSGPGKIEIEPELVSVHDLDINDPSGLAMDASGEFLWTVSDASEGQTYKIGLSGEILDTLPYEGDDMEGITMNSADHTLWIAEEKLRQAVQLDTLGVVKRIVEMPGNSVNDNDGPEGIAVNPENGHLYVLNEKNPVAFIELNVQNGTETVRNIAIDFEVPFNLSDLSGLTFDEANNVFWILSDESSRIVITDHNLNHLHFIELEQQKFEGIAVDTNQKRFYLVNDEEDKLYVYRY